MSERASGETIRTLDGGLECNGSTPSTARKPMEDDPSINKVRIGPSSGTSRGR